ncbi:hypothetical protein [Aliivibrio fischeri]|uniref:hypothetical protein n=1 Tax=Aliivibrio fischeri TaxID=668 RepID=UPI0007C5B356|nr:hypothetical protein [Aliivibrio fischeri]MBP3155250.1 hypothetical protein [Aliivibrio fischeri]MCE7575828.1 hypothetical protein [Aliivibrio fischeri]
MMKVVKFILLFIPLYWYVLLWDGFVFKIGIPEPPIGNDVPSWVESWLVPLFWFVGTPLSFFIGSAYAFRKKYWVWFGAYMILGGLPVMLFFLGAIIG